MELGAPVGYAAGPPVGASVPVGYCSGVILSYPVTVGDITLTTVGGDLTSDAGTGLTRTHIENCLNLLFFFKHLLSIVNTLFNIVYVY